MEEKKQIRREEIFPDFLSEFDLEILRKQLKQLIPCGVVNLSGGVARVSHPLCTASSIIFALHRTISGTQGILRANPQNGYFEIRSSSGSDNSSVFWMLIP